MKLKSATIKDFKRFKELTIQGLPANGKLIVLLGPNGCGKSSLFDAFQRKLKVDTFYGMNETFKKYYRRAMPGNAAKSDEVDLEFYGSNPTSQEALKKSLYVRSAYRHDPSFQEITIEQQGNILDRHSVRRLIDTDQTVRNNYQRIIWQLLRKATTRGLTTDAIIGETIGDIQKSMKLVFGDINVDALVSAEDTGTFTFTKGESRNFLYENLSAGEKAAFDLLLDIVVNKAAFDDSLYCIDEPEAHLNTGVQRKLLKELYRLIPENSQLWLATHSIGMVRAAQDMRAANISEDQVVFLDMGFAPDGEQRDYDQPQTVEPSDPDHRFWKRHYFVALDDMAELLAPDALFSARGLPMGLMLRLMKPVTAGYSRRSFREHVSFPSDLRRQWKSVWEIFFWYWNGLSRRCKSSDSETGMTPHRNKSRRSKSRASRFAPCRASETSNQCCSRMVYWRGCARVWASLIVSTRSKQPEKTR